jgi:phosphatidylglycerol---prolipoprotein diacylglyceryl transferase
MHGLHIGINPIIFHLGPLQVRWYGVLMMTGVVVGAYVTSLEARRKGFGSGYVWEALLLVVPLGVIGARLFHIVDNFSFYWHNPGQIIGPQLVGLAIYGAVTGGIIGVVLYARLRRLPVLPFLDCAAIGLPVAQFIGRFANIINGDTWGGSTTMPWGFIYTNPNAFLPASLRGVPTHPTPVYEQLWLLIALGIMLAVRKRLKADGSAIMLYVVLYSFGRFFISFFRENKILLLGMREAQLLALTAIVMLVPIIIVREWRARRAAPLSASSD